MVRKSWYCAASNLCIHWYPRHERARLRHRHNSIDGCVNGIEELDAQALPALFVPSAGEPVLGVGFVLKTNARIHRRRNSDSARRRTSTQGIPAVSPAITRRARRSISAAHAASTSAGSSAAASSRLARSSAARSARSLTGRAIASRRSSCARGDMKPFYTSTRQPNIIALETARSTAVGRAAAQRERQAGEEVVGKKACAKARGDLRLQSDLR